MKISTRKICLLGVLTAITAILSIYATFRIGNQIKIPMKFISVFITGAIFGPLASGVVAAIADVLNAILVPVGPPLPQITAVEFCCGFIFGAFFYKAKDTDAYYIRAFICSLIQFAIGILVMSKILTDVGYFSGFYAAVSVRLFPVVITFIIHMLVLCAGKGIVFRLKKFVLKDEQQ